MSLIKTVCVSAFLLSCLSVSEGALTTTPVSQAALSGSSVTLNCTGDKPLNREAPPPYEWLYSSVSSCALERIVYDCQVNPDYEGKYVTEVTEDGGCSLTIPDANFQSAGTYTCLYGFEHGSADIVMLERDPVCAYGPTDLVDGDGVSLMCYVMYNGSMAPTMEWRSNTGELMTNSTHTTHPYEVGSRLIVPVYVPSVSGHTCQTFFEHTFDYNYTWTLPTVYVQYPAENAAVAVRGKSYCGDEFAPDTTLTCSADGYPPPTYTWTDMDTGYTYNGSTVTLVNLGTNHWLCEASNTIRDTVYISTTEIYVNVSDDILGTIQIQANDGTGMPKDWDSFKYGFTDGPTFWIGNECLHRMTSQGSYTLHLDLEGALNSYWYWAEYEDFYVGPESTNYTLDFGAFNMDSTAGDDALAVHKGMQFSTYDKDNDRRTDDNCAELYGGGFWLNDCHAAGINNIYPYFDWWTLPTGDENLNECIGLLIYTPPVELGVHGVKGQNQPETQSS